MEMQTLSKSHFQLAFYQFIVRLIGFNLSLSSFVLMALTFPAVAHITGGGRKHINLKVLLLFSSVAASA